MDLQIRWLQRLENYKNAYSQLKEAVRIYRERGLNELEKQGIIQSFEYTFELAWNLIRDYFIYQGFQDVRGPRDAIKTAFKYNIIDNGEIWMEMITTRNLSSHTYNKNIAEDIVRSIVEMYFFEFEKLYRKFEEIKKNNVE